ncbi:lipid IV(A) 3-deoxy-D-manno-octulosonic acid transferase [Salinicola sp. DM10]|uniref:lipid IV(A) 3-deoxy-D-manno-octulosonic acid transferase n=1 Tax=Salinicola sp. DM10 TaxID=2815721 RepID=UPI001A8C85EC|nr:lipid IV(A) 3-deoxy-D-manno-octulosonic acid transferase [Salinicola sp. DM10]MCE3027872.1 lipid IV(A) 3-deoxy-D-manno-octulosonic acid transferase [Salinicola sp. DM10]
MSPRLARRLYSLLLYLLSPLIWWRVWREWLPTHPRRERLGYVPAVGARRCIWLHAASVGEVVTATPLIRALLDDYPDHALIVTTMTATGARQLQQTFGDRVRHHFLPLDFPGATRRFVARINPRLTIIAETELWPNLLAACYRRDIPVVVANARLSPGAFRLYRRLGALCRGMLAPLDWIGAKSPSDAERFRTLGARPEAVAMTGALKFDLNVDESVLAASRRLRQRWGPRPVWIAGSTHPGEDEQVLAAHARVRRQLPDSLLILVPRHPQRFEAVAELCEAAGERLVRLSAGARVDAETTLLLGDTMGDLIKLYGCADVAFVGGSLVTIGGHNLLEPAALGVAVVSGPHLDNLREIADTLAEHEARCEVADGEALGQTVAALLDDAPRRERLGAAGRQVVAANRGALAATRQHLATYLLDTATGDS